MTDWLSREQRSRNMSAIRSTGTAPEQRLGFLLKDMFPRRKQVPHPELPGRPDYLLPGLRLVVFADGCFWHGCPHHGHIPQANRDYWEPKLHRNALRDRMVTRQLRSAGFVVVRVWDHELKPSSVKARTKIRRALNRVNRAA